MTLFKIEFEDSVTYRIASENIETAIIRAKQEYKLQRKWPPPEINNVCTLNHDIIVDTTRYD